MTNVFIKPAADADGKPLLVRDPETGQPLGDQGEWKTASPYWLHRLRDGDAVDATPAPAVDAADPVVAPPMPVPRRSVRQK